MTLAILAYLIWWTLPALDEARRTDSPPVLAARWIAQHVPASATQLYVDRRMGPFTRYFLANYRQTDVDDTFTGTEVADPAHAWFIGEGSNVFQEAINFRRARGRLWNIVRRRYFEISVRPITSSVSFGRGWYDEESAGGDVWRWMGPRSETRLSAIPGRARLHFDFHFPSDGKQPFPVVTISLNGQVVDRFRPRESEIEKTYTVAGLGKTPNDVVIETDSVVNLSRAGIAHDARDLGVELLGLSWRPLP